MNKLLRAGMIRLWKEKIFWCCVLFSAGFGIMICVSQYYNMKKYDLDLSVSSMTQGFFTMVAIVLAAFVVLFIGTEYSDGTIRNKLICGNSRSSIYLSNYVLGVIGGILIESAYLLTVLVMGIPMFGVKAEEWKMIAIYSGAGFMMILADVALFTCLSMLCQNKAVAVTAALIGTFVLMLLASYLINALFAPEFYDTTVIKNGTAVTEHIRNERYLTGIKREIYQFVSELLPTGQGMYLGAGNATHPGILAVYSGVIAVLATVAGVLGFSKKDLK